MSNPIETEYGWILDLKGVELFTLTLDYKCAAYLHDRARKLSISVEHRCEVISRITLASCSPSAIDATELAPLLSCLGQKIESSVVTNGVLEIAFENGSLLRVLPSQQYGGWEVVYGWRATCFPGGDVDVVDHPPTIEWP